MSRPWLEPENSGMWSKEYRERFPEWALVVAARSRAKRNDIPFDIWIDDIDIPDVCPYLKTPFVKGTMYAASLDRVDPRLGYIKGNIEVISRKANMMKSNATVEELLEFAYTILERH